MLRSATIAAALGLSGAAVVNDSVPFLPGLEQALPSALYSGYMEPSRGHFLHYIFMESWNDPATDPVIVWMNGGPGSSSMGGLFTELGPFVTSDESFPNGPDTGPYTVKLNPYTWNANASVIYLEQPAGVGFSYCNPASPCAFNDATQADDTFAFLEKFFEGFPEFKDNEFYLTAESYGGVYVPTLAENLITKPNTINFKGLAIGNPTFRSTTLSLSPREQVHADFFYGHGQFSPTTYRKIATACDWAAKETSAACNAALDTMSEEIGGYNVYNIYDQCKLANDDVSVSATAGDTGAAESGLKTFREWEEILGGDPDNFDREPLVTAGSPTETPDFGYLCGASRGEKAYLNEPEVREALHVCSFAQCGSFPNRNWTAPYGGGMETEALLYKSFIAKGLRVMIYSGDVDACLPYTGTEEWIHALDLPTVEAWRPWTLDNATQMGGYVTTYNQPAGEKSSFLFVTVRGAGHMVPRYRAEEAQMLINKFFAGEVLPGYTAPPRRPHKDDEL